MKKITVTIAVWVVFYCCSTKDNSDGFVTLFEKTNGTETASYDQVITYYKELATVYPEITLHEMGQTDSRQAVTFSRS